MNGHDNTIQVWIFSEPQFLIAVVEALGLIPGWDSGRGWKWTSMISRMITRKSSQRSLPSWSKGRKKK